MRLDLAGGYGAPQRLLDAGDALGGLFHLARVDDDAAAAGALGLVERRLGLVDQDLGRLVAEMEQRTADRSRKARRALADIVGRRQYLDQHARLVGRGVLAEDQRIEEGELVGADARHRRVAVHRRAQPHGDLDQYVVAGLAAEQVVDRLEAVEVEDADRERRRVLGAIADQAIHLVVEAAMIAEPGQRIREREFRAFPAGIAVRKHGLHFGPACCSVLPGNLPVKRLGKVSRERVKR